MDNKDIYLIAGIILILILLVLIIVLAKRHKPKDKKLKIDESFINNILSILGTTKNIITCEVVNARLKFDVKDLDIVNFEELKKLSNKGVFITNNTIKVLFKYNSEDIKNKIKKLL